MTDLSPDCAALFRTVLDSPRDPLPKLVLADYLDERGEPVLAHAFRWCAAYKRHPEYGPAALAPGWWRSSTGHDECELTPEFLPDLVAHAMPNAHDRGDHWANFAALADALETLAAVVRLPRD